jgi:beta-glucuronidase
VGDKGTGAMRQRVHGVVDLYAHRKPSFSDLRIQSSPFERLSILNAADDSYSLVVVARKRLPGYTLRGYCARWVVFGYDDLPMHGVMDPLPELHPGESHTIHATLQVEGARRIALDILRPTGFSAAGVELLVNSAFR